jgi:hypothetical protein
LNIHFEEISINIIKKLVALEEFDVNGQLRKSATASSLYSRSSSRSMREQ